MNKFNKGKLLGVVAASLSAVSLMGVGFATWIIGTQNKVADGEIAIEADDVSYKSLKVSVAFTGGIRLAETGTENPNEVFNFKADADKKGNFTVKAKFTFTLGQDFVAADFDFTKVNFSIVSATEAEKGFKDNKVAANNVKVERENTENLTYFDCGPAVTIDKAADLKFDTAVSNKYKTTECTKDITFTWGSLFGVAGPNAFYNAKYKTLTEKEGTTQAQQEQFLENAYDELKAMHDTYSATGSKIKLKIELANN